MRPRTRLTDEFMSILRVGPKSIVRSTSSHPGTICNKSLLTLLWCLSRTRIRLPSTTRSETLLTFALMFLAQTAYHGQQQTVAHVALLSLA